MRLRIETTTEEPTITLALEEFRGGVRITARKGGDPAWNLLTFLEDGRVHRTPSVSTDLGFEVDGDGLLKIE